MGTSDREKPEKQKLDLKSLKDPKVREQIFNPKSPEPPKPKVRGPQEPRVLPDISSPRHGLSFDGEEEHADYVKPIAAGAAEELGRENPEDTTIADETPDPKAKPNKVPDDFVMPTGFERMVAREGAIPENAARERDIDWSASVGPIMPTFHKVLTSGEVLQIPLSKEDVEVLDAIHVLHRIEPHSEDWYKVYQDIAASHHHKDSVYSLEQTLQKYPRMTDMKNDEIRATTEKLDAFMKEAKRRKTDMILKAEAEEKAARQKQKE